MKVFIILSLFGLALGQQNGEPRDTTSCADMPTFMQDADRIVGGEAAESPIPWQVAVLSGTFQYCGATVLDANTILCAAHCEPSTSDSIRVGSTSRSSGGQTRNIAQVIYNNNPGFQYNSGTLNNDFVILKLSSPLTLNDEVKPACLPSSSEYLGVASTEPRCFTSGWGTLSSGGSSTDALQYVRVPAITNTQCNSAYGGSITNAMICAGYPGVGGKDACQGDSGGPFVCNDGGKAVIAGVVSWGNGCALADFPGVYARTTHVLDWIKSQMGGSVTPTPTTAPPPTSGCGSPQWKGDGYCDDNNNNAECQYDGGDCCNNNANGWNQFCDDCKCLDPNDSGTTSAPPTTAPPTTTNPPTTLPPTTAPPSGCGTISDWVGDGYCDDVNNNAECNYDEGDCCNNTGFGWDDFCDACECIDPNAVTPECVDDWSSSKCQKKMQQGKCNKTWVGRNCKETCGFCGCIDIWPADKCNKKKGNCNWPFIAEVCKETCDLC